MGLHCLLFYLLILDAIPSIFRNFIMVVILALTMPIHWLLFCIPIGIKLSLHVYSVVMKIDAVGSDTGEKEKLFRVFLSSSHSDCFP